MGPPSHPRRQRPRAALPPVNDGTTSSSASSPLLVTAEAFAPKGPGQPKYTVPVGNLQANQRVAATDGEFMSLVTDVFRSATVRSLIQSLIAASNEASPADGAETASSTEPAAE
jgi:hypothetical protein